MLIIFQGFLQRGFPEIPFKETGLKKIKESTPLRLRQTYIF